MSLLYEPIFYLLFVSPILLLGKKKEAWEPFYLALFAAYFILDFIMVSLPFSVEAVQFIQGEMNWEGKIFSYVLAILFLLLYRRLPWSEYGLQFQQRAGSLGFGWRSVGIVAVLFTIYGYLIGGYSGGAENIAFQFTMPSIVEEIAYRGILLGLLNQVFPRNWKLGKAHIGWGVVITSILFGLLHGLRVDAHFAITFNWPPIILTGVIGFILGWVRERTDSLVFPIILHILINTIPIFVGMLL